MIINTRTEADAAAKKAYTAIIYEINNQYKTTIEHFSTEEEAESALDEIRAEIASDAHALDLKSECQTLIKS